MCVCVCVCVCLCVHVCVCVCMRACVCACVCVHVFERKEAECVRQRSLPSLISCTSVVYFPYYLLYAHVPVNYGYSTSPTKASYTSQLDLTTLLEQNEWSSVMAWTSGSIEELVCHCVMYTFGSSGSLCTSTKLYL